MEVTFFGRRFRMERIWERLQNGTRAIFGIGLVVIGVGVIGLGVYAVPPRPGFQQTPRASSPEAGAPTPVVPLPRTLFPQVPAVGSRSDAELARDRTVRTVFAPFTADGEMNFVPNHAELVRTDGPAPLAYRWLRAAGKLERVEDFVAVATDPRNDRPHWPQPMTAADWEAARGLRALYERLGPLWDTEG